MNAMLNLDDLIQLPSCFLEAMFCTVSSVACEQSTFLMQAHLQALMQMGSQTDQVRDLRQQAQGCTTGPVVLHLLRPAGCRA